MSAVAPIILCVALVVIDNVVRALRIRLLLAGATPVPSFFASLAVNAIGEAASAVTPFRIGGEASRVAAFQRGGISPIRSVVALTAEAAMSYPILALYAVAITALFAPGWWRATRASVPVISVRRELAVAIVIATVLVTAAGILLARRRRRSQAAPGASPPRGRWSAALHALPRRSLMLAVPLSAINIAARLAILPVLVTMLPTPPAIGTTVVASFALLYGQMLLPTPSGAGAVDYGFVAGVAGDLRGRAQYLLLVWRLLTTGLAIASGILAVVVWAALAVRRRRRRPLNSQDLEGSMMFVPPVGTDDLRLAICSDTFLPQVNGVARTLARLADAVRARGGDVRVFTSADPLAAPDPTVRRFPSIPFWAYPQLQLAAPAPALLERELRDWGATLVHAATPFGIGLAARAAARRAGIPFVTSYHTSLSSYARFYRLGALAAPGWRFLRWFHNSGARTYCPTNAIADELREHGFANVTIWSRGVDTERFDPRFRSAALREQLGADDDTVIVAYVGRIAVEKGLDVAIDGMARAIAAPGRRILFALAGDGPWAEECRRRLSTGMVLLGELHGRALSELYASADVFLFPSTTDTFGNVLLEAMASGLPIAAATAAPTRELLGEGGPGIFFNGGCPTSLADAVRAVTEDCAARAGMQRAALNAVQHRRWSAVFDELFEDYAEVVGGDASGPAPRDRIVAEIGLR